MKNRYGNLKRIFTPVIEAVLILVSICGINIIAGGNKILHQQRGMRILQALVYPHLIQFPRLHMEKV